MRAGNAIQELIKVHPQSVGLKLKVYPLAAPQGAVMPYVIYRPRPVPEHHLAGAGGLDQGSLDLAAFDTDYPRLLRVVQTIRAAIDGFHGQVSVAGDVIPLRRCQIGAVEFDTIPPQAGQSLPIFVADLPVDVATTEPIPTFP